jgi:uncharacterized protein
LKLVALRSTPGVGVAYSARTPPFLASHPGSIDYIEIPFELLQHAPGVGDIAKNQPVVLHCASLSVAGSVPAADETFAAVQDWVDRLDSPWLGEHLSFISADPLLAGAHADAYAPGEPYNIGYTVSPPWNAETLGIVTTTIARAAEQLSVPMILENPPIYFRVPGSTMTQTEFIAELCAQTPVGLLLDLAHFYISSETVGFDPLTEIQLLPLDRVVEVHISGVDEETGAHWDNHAARAPKIEFDLLQVVRAGAHDLRAVTLEYNWSAKFPNAVLLEEIARTREALVPGTA